MTRIDRRALFTSGAAAALLTATGVSLQAAPRSGGRLRLAVARENNALMHVVRGAVFETLTEIASDGVLRQELAVGWQGDKNAREWVFDLRDGVEFHDGKALEARDVAASIQAHGHDLLPGVKSVAAIGRLRVRLELTHGNPDLPYLLASPALFIAPGGQVDRPLAKAVGTGLYRVSQLQEKRHFLGHRIPSHHKDGLAGWAESIEVIVIPRADIRAEALRDGYVDVASLPLPDGLLGRGDFQLFPSAQKMVLAAHRGVGVPKVIGAQSPLDDGRIGERWWMLAG